MTQTCVDAKGLRCPLPLLKLKQALAKADIGDKVQVLATDGGSWRDIPAFVSLTQHQMTSMQEADGVYVFIVEKGE